MYGKALHQAYIALGIPLSPAVPGGERLRCRVPIRSMLRMLCAIALAFVSFGAKATPADESIVIDETESSFIVTVPISQVVMEVPKGTLIMKSEWKGTSYSHPRYFIFKASHRALILTGWFEPAQAFEGLENHWASENQAWKKNGLPEPLNVVIDETGIWQTVMYEMDVPDITNSHIRAHLVRSGTWIDLHLSLTSLDSPEENRKLLLSLLESITVKDKPSSDDVSEQEHLSP